MNRRIVMLVIVLTIISVVVGLAFFGTQTEEPRDAYSSSLAEVEARAAGMSGKSVTDAPLTTLRRAAEAARETHPDETDTTDEVAVHNAVPGTTGGSDADAPADNGDTGEGAADASGDPSDSSGDTSDPSVVPAPAEPSGLTLEERKSCFWDLVEAEDAAVAEAEDTYPISAGADSDVVTAHVKLRLELMEIYETEVADRYGLTLAQVDAVTYEGITSGWPMPPLQD